LIVTHVSTPWWFSRGIVQVPVILLMHACCCTHAVPADSFQEYCQSALAFSIKRGGILYGTGMQVLARSVR
jgi:hypothetical protein